MYSSSSLAGLISSLALAFTRPGDITTTMSATTSNNNNLRIYLARHGQDEDNAAGILNGHRDQPLTSIGIQQAKTVAAKIRSANLSFDAIYSSPLRRARRTAEIIAEEGECTHTVSSSGGSSESESATTAAAVQTYDKLIERDFGIMTGIPTKEIMDRCSPNVLVSDTITYFLGPKDAETFPDLIARANGVIEDICQRHHHNVNDENKLSSVLLVTHGDFGKMLYAAYYNLGWEDVLRQFHFGNSEVLLLAKHSTPDQAHVFQIEQHNH